MCTMGYGSPLKKEGNLAICYTLNETGWRDNAKWKSQTKTNTEGYCLYVESLKKKKQVECIETTKADGQGLRGWGKEGEVGERLKLLVIRWRRSEDLLYSMMTLADSAVLCNWNLLRE